MKKDSTNISVLCKPHLIINNFYFLFLVSKINSQKMSQEYINILYIFSLFLSRYH